ncbi:MAG: (d)CMP kinase [Proteobacteria bacterium]|nr:(d)CMP kinase [Pseudomonadota bacterium]
MAFVIAVDGPAASGKGTIAGRLAALYDYPLLDTGLLYRAVGVAILDGAGDLDDPIAAEAVARTLDLSALDRAEVRTRAAGEAASRCAVHPGVRAALLDLQQAFAAREPGSVIDGRDIGTVIAPHAPAKLYVTARPEVRAARRWKQLVSQGEEVAFEDILADIHKRDARDGGRKDAPMTQAADAVLLDTSEMTIEQAFDAARRIVEDARARHRL